MTLRRYSRDANSSRHFCGCGAWMPDELRVGRAAHRPDCLRGAENELSNGFAASRAPSPFLFGRNGDEVMTRRSKDHGITHTPAVDTLMQDINVKPALIGDMVHFCDNAGVRWRGVVLDIRRCGVWAGGGCDGLLVEERAVEDVSGLASHLFRPNAGTWAEAPMPWAFVACIAQPQTVPVRLTRCWPQDRGWWHRGGAPLPPETEERKDD